MSEVIVEITLAGTPLFTEDGTMGSRFTRGAPGEPATVRGEDDTVASKTGRSFYPRVADVLPIGLSIWLHAGDVATDAAGWAEVELGRRALLELLSGAGATKTLEATLADGSTAEIQVHVIPPVMVNEVIPGLRLEFDVALESVDPEWVITPAGS